MKKIIILSLIMFGLATTTYATTKYFETMLDANSTGYIEGAALYKENIIVTKFIDGKNTCYIASKPTTQIPQNINLSISCLK